jgi:tRNA (cmo5U34)-methyltransferase
VGNNRFDGLAGKEYDLIKVACPHYDEFENMVGIQLRKHFADVVKPKISVLEIGTGTGVTSKIVLSSGKNFVLTTIDNESVMVEQAKKNLKKFGSNVKVFFFDALDFLHSLEDNSFDAIVSAETIHNMDSKYRDKLFVEIYRVLKNDGIFINADKYVSDNKKEFEKELNWQLSMINSGFKKIGREDLAKEWEQHYYFDAMPNLVMKEKDSIKKLDILGFKRIEIVFKKHLDAVLVAQKGE